MDSNSAKPVSHLKGFTGTLFVNIPCTYLPDGSICIAETILPPHHLIANPSVENGILELLNGAKCHLEAASVTYMEEISQAHSNFLEAQSDIARKLDDTSSKLKKFLPNGETLENIPLPTESNDLPTSSNSSFRSESQQRELLPKTPNPLSASPVCMTEKKFVPTPPKVPRKTLKTYVTRDESNLWPCTICGHKSSHLPPGSQIYSSSIQRTVETQRISL